jgi:hypothetical protein
MIEETAINKPAERLRTAREKAGFPSAAAAARHHGWGEAAYRHHENGTRAFGIEQGIQYAAAYKVAASWLLALVDSSDSHRLPIARFYVQVYAQNLGEGSDLYELIDDIWLKLGLKMFPELSVDVNKFEWILGPSGIPPMHFIDPSEIDVDAAVLTEGFVFAYRVGRRFPQSRMVVGSVLLVDSSIAEVELTPALYLLRDDVGAFVRTAQRTSSGDTLLMPDTAGGTAISASDMLNFDVVGKVIWIGQRA